MNNKIVGILIVIIVGLIVIGGIIYVIFFHKFSSPQLENNITEQPAVLNQTVEPVKQSIIIPSTGTAIKAPVKKVEINENDLIKIASAFAERFGSFSNQSDYGNMRDLKLFMSSKMQIWADNYVAQARASNQQTAIYYGITTKAITAEMKQFDGESGKAEILVKSQRKEATGTTANSANFYQNIIIKFVKEKGAWKVDSAEWQAK